MRLLALVLLLAAPVYAKATRLKPVTPDLLLTVQRIVQAHFRPPAGKLIPDREGRRGDVLLDLGPEAEPENEGAALL